MLSSVCLHVRTSDRLFLCLRRSVLWLNNTSFNKSVWTVEQKLPLGTRFYNFQLAYTYPISSNSPPLEPQTLLSFSECIKTCCKQVNHQNVHVWNRHRIVSRLHGYSRQRRTIGCFLATAAGATIVSLFFPMQSLNKSIKYTCNKV